MSTDPSFSIKKAFSWRRSGNDEMPPPPPRRATLPPSPRGWVEQTVSAYNLKWPDLRRYLIGLYQITDGRRLNERQEMYEDKSYFWVPRELSEAEQRTIDTLRARPDDRDQRDNSPDPAGMVSDDFNFN
ncbi:uncharacterized protein CCOS01_10778 [Colletotrichum costaricense]|uniref:Uncharacterized protein n=1 Tax=Colletotrichum costaricense TaxID=1209916 RepID=A0AAI9YS34_9PEZI|nr:uncharacterized protein CCOS01_10778 [Colletotrichum costaricense]KAK1520659.1 hypothetical protein CCOS01_10778 [Colletotrichum costaricense]